MNEPSPSTPLPSFSSRERRVLGVLVEKQKTTPEYYPMTVAAVVTGSNQKTNRDPVTNLDADDAEDILHGLRKSGAVVMVEGSGRVPKWKHSLYDLLDLKGRAAEMAVLAELLLRGPQTEGDLRARASRMDDIPDLPALQAILQTLAARKLVVYLSPPGQKRGVIVTHGLYPAEELERLRTAQSQVETDDEPPARHRASPDELAMLREDMDAMRRTIAALSNEVAALKAALGA